ncbi:MAG: hypothetical protein L7U55_04725 [Candidatus Nanopelagicales bacterium]|nr:hypothetical protein [Candidatus Nanopelagicales bacterium]MCH1448030.1 hypothetical protein [Candidatus Nanopelagicales bacterium]NKB91609.1 hypothetical protein [Candidatus Nanopelagicales bacterium]
MSSSSRTGSSGLGWPSDVSRETSTSGTPLVNPGLGWPDPTTVEQIAMGDPT